MRGERPIRSLARAALAQLLLELAVAAHEAAALDRAAHGGAHAVVVERLREIVERAGADAVDRALDARVARDHDHLDLGVLALQALEQRATAVAAEAEVEQHDVGIGLGEPRLRGLRGLGERGPVTFALERPAQRAQEQRLVVDQQHGAGRAAFGRPVRAHGRNRHASSIGHRRLGLKVFSRTRTRVAQEKPVDEGRASATLRLAFEHHPPSAARRSN